MARGNPWTARLAEVAKFIGRLIYVAVVWVVCAVVWVVCVPFRLIYAAGRVAFRHIYADERREAELAAERRETELTAELRGALRANELLKAEFRGVLRGVEFTLSVLERSDAQHSSAKRARRLAKRARRQLSDRP